MLLRTSVEGYIAAMIAVRDFDVSAQLEKVSTPTLLITGLEDKATPISEAQLIAKKTLLFMCVFVIVSLCTFLRLCVSVCISLCMGLFTCIGQMRTCVS